MSTNAAYPFWDVSYISDKEKFETMFHGYVNEVDLMGLVNLEDTSATVPFSGNLPTVTTWFKYYRTLLAKIVQNIDVFLAFGMVTTDFLTAMGSQWRYTDQEFITPFPLLGGNGKKRAIVERVDKPGKFRVEFTHHRWVLSHISDSSPVCPFTTDPSFERANYPLDASQEGNSQTSFRVRRTDDVVLCLSGDVEDEHNTSHEVAILFHCSPNAGIRPDWTGTSPTIEKHPNGIENPNLFCCFVEVWGRSLAPVPTMQDPGLAGEKYSTGGWNLISAWHPLGTDTYTANAEVPVLMSLYFANGVVRGLPYIPRLANVDLQVLNIVPLHLWKPCFSSDAAGGIDGYAHYLAMQRNRIQHALTGNGTPVPSAPQLSLQVFSEAFQVPPVAERQQSGFQPARPDVNDIPAQLRQALSWFGASDIPPVQPSYTPMYNPTGGSSGAAPNAFTPLDHPVTQPSATVEGYDATPRSYDPTAGVDGVYERAFRAPVRNVAFGYRQHLSGTTGGLYPASHQPSGAHYAVPSHSDFTRAYNQALANSPAVQDDQEYDYFLGDDDYMNWLKLLRASFSVENVHGQGNIEIYLTAATPTMEGVMTAPTGALFAADGHNFFAMTCHVVLLFNPQNPNFEVIVHAEGTVMQMRWKTRARQIPSVRQKCLNHLKKALNILLNGMDLWFDAQGADMTDAKAKLHNALMHALNGNGVLDIARERCEDGIREVLDTAGNNYDPIGNRIPMENAGVLGATMQLPTGLATVLDMPRGSQLLGWSENIVHILSTDQRLLQARSHCNCYGFDLAAVDILGNPVLLRSPTTPLYSIQARSKLAVMKAFSTNAMALTDQRDAGTQQPQTQEYRGRQMIDRVDIFRSFFPTGTKGFKSSTAICLLRLLCWEGMLSGPIHTLAPEIGDAVAMIPLQNKNCTVTFVPQPPQGFNAAEPLLANAAANPFPAAGLADSTIGIEFPHSAAVGLFALVMNEEQLAGVMKGEIDAPLGFSALDILNGNTLIYPTEEIVLTEVMGWQVISRCEHPFYIEQTPCGVIFNDQFVYAASTNMGNGAPGIVGNYAAPGFVNTIVPGAGPVGEYEKITCMHNGLKCHIKGPVRVIFLRERARINMTIGAVVVPQLGAVPAAPPVNISTALWILCRDNVPSLGVAIDREIGLLTEGELRSTFAMAAEILYRAPEPAQVRAQNDRMLVASGTYQSNNVFTTRDPVTLGPADLSSQCGAPSPVVNFNVFGNRTTPLGVTSNTLTNYHQSRCNVQHLAANRVGNSAVLQKAPIPVPTHAFANHHPLHDWLQLAGLLAPTGYGDLANPSLYRRQFPRARQQMIARLASGMCLLADTMYTSKGVTVSEFFGLSESLVDVVAPVEDVFTLMHRFRQIIADHVISVVKGTLPIEILYDVYDKRVIDFAQGAYNAGVYVNDPCAMTLQFFNGAAWQAYNENLATRMLGKLLRENPLAWRVDEVLPDAHHVTALGDRALEWKSLTDPGRLEPPYVPAGGGTRDFMLVPLQTDENGLVAESDMAAYQNVDPFTGGNSRRFTCCFVAGNNLFARAITFAGIRRHAVLENFYIRQAVVSGGVRVNKPVNFVTQYGPTQGLLPWVFQPARAALAWTMRWSHETYPVMWPSVGVDVRTAIPMQIAISRPDVYASVGVSDLSTRGGVVFNSTGSPATIANSSKQLDFFRKRMSRMLSGNGNGTGTQASQEEQPPDPQVPMNA